MFLATCCKDDFGLTNRVSGFLFMPVRILFSESVRFRCFDHILFERNIVKGFSPGLPFRLRSLCRECPSSALTASPYEVPVGKAIIRPCEINLAASCMSLVVIEYSFCIMLFIELLNCEDCSSTKLCLY